MAASRVGNCYIPARLQKRTFTPTRLVQPIAPERSTHHERKVQYIRQ
jgi:hypothetical protein